MLATVAIASVVPNVIFDPVAGAVIDRLDRRKLMIAMNLANGLIVGTVATLLLPIGGVPPLAYARYRNDLPSTGIAGVHP